MRILPLLIALFFASSALAAPKKAPAPAAAGSAPAAPATEMEYHGAKVWLAPPVAAFVGFGLGHAVQDRLNGYPIAFTVADGLGFLLVASSLGDCRVASDCQKRKDRRHALGLGLLIASRVVQIVDVTIWSINYEGEPKVALSAVPTDGGMLASVGWKF